MAKKHTVNPQFRELDGVGKVTVIDATNTAAGRLGTIVVKRLLNGEEVHLVNAEKATISGTMDAVMARYNFKRTVGTRRKGPYYPRMPHMMLKRTMRGMLNYQELSSHRDAYKRLKAHIGVPDELADHTAIVEEKALSNAYRRVAIGEISKRLGAKF